MDIYYHFWCSKLPKYLHRIDKNDRSTDFWSRIGINWKVTLPKVTLPKWRLLPTNICVGKWPSTSVLDNDDLSRVWTLFLFCKVLDTVLTITASTPTQSYALIVFHASAFSILAHDTYLNFNSYFTAVLAVQYHGYFLTLYSCVITLRPWTRLKWALVFCQSGSHAQIWWWILWPNKHKYMYLIIY